MDPRKGQAQWQQQQQGGGGTFGSFQQQSGQGVQQQGQQQRQQGRQGYSYSYSSAYSSGPGGEYGQADFSQDKGSGGVEHHHVSWGPGQEPQHHHFSTQGQQQGGQQQGGQQQGGQQQGGQQQGGEQGMPEDLAALQQARNAVQMDSIRAVQGVGGGDGWKDSRMSSRGGGCGVGGSEEEGRRGGERGREVGEKVESRTKEENEEKEKEKEKEKKQEAWSSYETVFTNAKAGMEGVDKERVKRIVYAMSQGSRFFQHEQRKEAALLSKIAHMQRAKQAIPPEKLALLERQADGMLARMVAEASREERRRVWVHVDMDAFYAAVEALGDARLRDVPMAVGGMGMLCTANYETWAGEGEEEASREGRRVWVHVDMDAFYAAVEVLGDARLRDVPMAVGGMGMLCTANYETPLASPRLPLSPSALPPPFPVPLPFPARKYGVRAAMPGPFPPTPFPPTTFPTTPFTPDLSPLTPPHPLPPSPHTTSVQARKYGARKYGVRAAMPGFIARKLCPELVFVPPDSTKYQHYSNLTHEVFRQYDPHFVARSLDEAYLDITAVCEDRSMTPAQVAEELRHKVRSRHLENSFPTDCSPCLLLTSSPGPASPSVWQVAEELRHKVAEELRHKVHAHTGLTCSAGVAANRMLAKVCSDINKPNGQYVLPFDREAILSFISSLPIRKIGGVGKVTERLLRGVLGVKVCADIITHRGALLALFSPISAEFFLQAALGIGGSGDVEEGPRKSISCERTFSPLSAEPAILNKLEELSFALAKDLEEHGMKGRTLTLKLKTTAFEVRTRAVSVPEPIGSQQEISATSQSFRTHVCTRAHRVTAGGLSFRPLKALLFSSPLPPFLSPPHRPQVRTRAVSVPEPIGSQQEMWPLVVRLIRAELPVSVRLLGEWCRWVMSGAAGGAAAECRVVLLGLRMSALVPRASSGSSRQATISEVLGGRRAVGGSSAKGAAEGKYSTGSPEGKFPTGPTEGKHSAYMGVKRVEPSKSRGGEGRERLLEENSVEGEGWAHGGAERVEERRLGGEWREHARLPDARVQNETGEEVGGKEELRGCGDGGAELSGCEWEGGWDSESEWEECGEGMAEGMDGGRSGGGEREVREEREEREERDEKEEREEREEREEEEREEREERKEEEIEEREEEEEKERRESENREGREEREEREERMKNTDVEKACAQVGRRRMEERGDEEEEEAKEKEVTLALTQKAFQMPPMSFEDATHYQEGMEKQEMDETFAGEAGAGVPSGKRGKGGKGKKEKATREAATAAAVHRFVIAACSSRRHERSRSIW
ncbi:unnamed protein product [Closterium sp. NIES-64]|nr:unnamed protein product [Closterium sp. NIES-64]